MAKKQHDHGFEMVAIVAIVALVGLIILFMNTGNLSGEAFGGQKTPQKIQLYDECTTVNCASDDTHPCCNQDQVSALCDGTHTLMCGSGENSFQAYCTVVDDVAVYGCTK